MTNTVVIIKKAEFFIASKSFEDGSHYHRTRCSTDFYEALRFVMSLNPSTVFGDDLEMHLYHYKIHNNKISLEKDLNLNEYIIGAINKNNELIPIEEIQKKCIEKEGDDGLRYLNTFKSVKYGKIPQIMLSNRLSKNISVSVTLPNRDKSSEFILGCGYTWKDTDTWDSHLYDWIADDFYHDDYNNDCNDICSDDDEDN